MYKPEAILNFLVNIFRYSKISSSFSHTRHAFNVNEGVAKFGYDAGQIYRTLRNQRFYETSPLISTLFALPCSASSPSSSRACFFEPMSVEVEPKVAAGVATGGAAIVALSALSLPFAGLSWAVGAGGVLLGVRELPSSPESGLDSRRDDRL